MRVWTIKVELIQRDGCKELLEYNKMKRKEERERGRKMLSDSDQSTNP